MGGRWKSVSCDFSLGSQTRKNLVLRDGMLPDSYPARVVDRIRQRAGSGPNGCFRETFRSKEPAWLQAINKYVGLFWRFHDRREPVRQIPNAVMKGTRKLAIPGDAVGRHPSALDQRSMLIGVSQKRIHDVA